jgi:hypothetical protein
MPLGSLGATFGRAGRRALASIHRHGQLLDAPLYVAAGLDRLAVMAVGNGPEGAAAA